MPRIIHEDSKPREYWVTFLGVNGAIQSEHGAAPDGATDLALFGSLGKRVQILDYGVAFWGLDRSDSRTVIPFARIIRIEEVF